MIDSSERALILAPRGRDAHVAQEILAEAEIASTICTGIAELRDALIAGAGFAIVTEEAFAGADLRPIADWLEVQPEWSDMPFVLLTERGGDVERNPDAARLLETLGNVTFLERPFHPTTLISLVRSALRARRRQYEARARIETLRASEMRYRSLFNSIDAGFCIIEMVWDEGGVPVDYRFVEVNPAFEAHTGLTDSIGRSARELVPGHEDYWFEIYGRVADTGTPVRFENHAAGLGRWYDVHAFRMVGSEQGRVAVLFNDITKRREVEIALRELTATLEQRVEAATADREAALAKLHEAQKLETIGQLTGGVAHDFNNLLTPITGALDLLQRRYGDDPRAARLLSGAMQSAERAKTLVQRLLGFARRQALQTVPIDIVSLLDGLRDLLASSAGPGILFHIRRPDTLPPALADPNQLELALLNLCVNARDAMPEGGALTVAAELDSVGPGNEAKLTPGQYIRLSVTDTGIGMDADTLARAIEPFYSTKDTGRGTGLGLSMVHGLAGQLGGAFRLASKPGQGTRADLWLPLAAAAPAQRVVAVPADESARPRALSVLLVDDEELVRSGVAEMLREIGHRVTVAGGGAEALNRLAAGAVIDAVITDYKMPGIDGAELARRVNAMRPGTPVLLVTGYTGSTHSAPHLPRLEKPFRRAELAAALDRLIVAAPRYERSEAAPPAGS